MPNPNLSELRLIAKYGEDGASMDDGQSPNIYFAVSEDSDEIDHKYVYAAPAGGLYVELAHYTSVKQVVIQNMSQNPGIVFYIDNTTTAIVPNWVVSGQHISFCDPNVVTGIFLASTIGGDPPALLPTDWHIAICGRKD